MRQLRQFFLNSAFGLTFIISTAAHSVATIVDSEGWQTDRTILNPEVCTDEEESCEFRFSASVTNDSQQKTILSCETSRHGDIDILFDFSQVNDSLKELARDSISYYNSQQGRVAVGFDVAGESSFSPRGWMGNTEELILMSVSPFQSGDRNFLNALRRGNREGSVLRYKTNPNQSVDFDLSLDGSGRAINWLAEKCGVDLGSSHPNPVRCEYRVHVLSFGGWAAFGARYTGETESQCIEAYNRCRATAAISQARDPDRLYDCFEP